MASSDSGPLTLSRETQQETADASPGPRYRFRADLEIEHEGGEDLAGSNVTVINPQSGQRHIFTADEHWLCRAADGSNTLAGIRKAFKAETGRDISHGTLFAFFRRLRGLGLLQESDATDPQPTSAAVAHTKQLKKPGAAEMASGTVAHDDPAATVGPDSLRRESSGIDDSGALGGPKSAGHFSARGLESDALSSGRGVRARVPLQELSTEERAAEGKPARVYLFNPNTLLGVLAGATRPLKYILLPLLLVVAAALWISFQARHNLAQDIGGFDASIIPIVILGLSMAGLVARLTQATLIRYFGAEVNQFGIALTLGIPRFFFDLGGIAKLGRRAQLWVHAAPLNARAGLFGAGLLLWFATRQSAPSLSYLALVVSQIGLFALLISAVPLLPSDGYRWLATYFGRPSLRSEALRSIGVLAPAFDARALRANLVFDATGLRAVTLYGVAIVLTVCVIGLVAGAYLDVATTGDVHLITGMLAIAVIGALAAWCIALLNYGRGRKIDALDTGGIKQVLATWTGPGDVASDGPVHIGTVGKTFWAVAACALTALAFLSYRYEASGTFEILPVQRIMVSVRTSGEVKEVSVREGDWVRADQVVAKLSSDDQQREVDITTAELDRAKAQLAQFDGKTSSGDDDRLIDDLIGEDKISAGAKKDPVAANYIRTQAERVARAEVERLTRKLAFEKDQLAQTEVRAPREGRVMTPNVHHLTGTWLRRGAELLSLDDTRTLEAEINLPEADVGLVKVGDKVRLRPWSNEDREMAGTVTGIAPAAETKPYGMIVRIWASIPNQNGFLLPAMTGYAKIETEDMRVWEAFLRRIIRIVRVEMWSWIP